MTTLEKVIDLAGEIVESAVEIKAETELKTLFDELLVIEFVMTVEDEFDIEISEEDAVKLKIVGDVVAYVDLKKPVKKEETKKEDKKDK